MMGSYLTLCKNSDGITWSSHTYECTSKNVYLFLHVYPPSMLRHPILSGFTQHPILPPSVRRLPVGLQLISIILVYNCKTSEYRIPQPSSFDLQV